MATYGTSYVDIVVSWTSSSGGTNTGTAPAYYSSILTSQYTIVSGDLVGGTPSVSSSGSTITCVVLNPNDTIGTATFRVPYTYDLTATGGSITIQTANASASATEVTNAINNVASFEPSSASWTKTISPTPISLAQGNSATYTITGESGGGSISTQVVVYCTGAEIVITGTPSSSRFMYDTGAATIINDGGTTFTPSDCNKYLVRWIDASNYHTITSLTENGTYKIYATKTNYTNAWSSAFTLSVIPIITTSELTLEIGSTLGQAFALISYNVASNATIVSHAWQMYKEVTDEYGNTTSQYVDVTDSENIWLGSNLTRLIITDSNGISSPQKDITIIGQNDTIPATTTRGFPYLSGYLSTSYNNVMAGLDVSGVGNILKIDYKMTNATTAGYSLEYIWTSTATYYVPQAVKYTNQYGKFISFVFKFGTLTEITSYTNGLIASRALPAVSSADYTDFYFESPTITYHKDSGNTHALTYQLNFLASTAETNRVILGYRFIEQMLNFKTDIDNERKVYLSTETYGKFENLAPKGTLYSTITTSVSVDTLNKAVCLALGGDFSTLANNYKAWAIVDGNGNLLLAYNMTDPFNDSVKDASGVVYFNFRHTR